MRVAARSSEILSRGMGTLVRSKVQSRRGSIRRAVGILRWRISKVATNSADLHGTNVTLCLLKWSFLVNYIPFMSFVGCGTKTEPFCEPPARSRRGQSATVPDIDEATTHWYLTMCKVYVFGIRHNLSSWHNFCIQLSRSSLVECICFRGHVDDGLSLVLFATCYGPHEQRRLYELL